MKDDSNISMISLYDKPDATPRVMIIKVKGTPYRAKIVLLPGTMFTISKEANNLIEHEIPKA